MRLQLAHPAFALVVAFVFGMMAGAIITADTMKLEYLKKEMARANAIIQPMQERDALIGQAHEDIEFIRAFMKEWGIQKIKQGIDLDNTKMENRVLLDAVDQYKE